MSWTKRARNDNGQTLEANFEGATVLYILRNEQHMHFTLPGESYLYLV